MLEVIKIYPNHSLTQENKEVSVIDEEILHLGEEMLKIVIENKGVGLAAPQIGKNLRALVIRLEESDGDKIYFALNPEIVHKSGNLVDSQEGCFSFPGLSVNVKRDNHITVKYMNSLGKEVLLEATGFLSAVFQHEIDHLNGILLCDVISNTQKKRLRKYFKSLEVLNKKLNKKLK